MTVDTLPTTTDQLLRDRVDALVNERLEQLATERIAEQVAAAMKKDPDKTKVALNTFYWQLIPPARV